MPRVVKHLRQQGLDSICRGTTWTMLLGMLDPALCRQTAHCLLCSCLPHCQRAEEMSLRDPDGSHQPCSSQAPAAAQGFRSSLAGQ